MAARLRVYDEHLFAVSASAPDSYPEIADVMKRYETLVSANNVSSLRQIDEATGAAPVASVAHRLSLTQSLRCCRTCGRSWRTRTGK